MDSNHRRRKPADLQSAPVGRLGIPPNFYRLPKAQVSRSHVLSLPLAAWRIPPDPVAAWPHQTAPQWRRVQMPLPTPRTRRCSMTPGFRLFAPQRLRIFAARSAQVNPLRHRAGAICSSSWHAFRPSTVRAPGVVPGKNVAMRYQSSRLHATPGHDLSHLFRDAHHTSGIVTDVLDGTALAVCLTEPGVGPGSKPFQHLWGR